MRSAGFFAAKLAAGIGLAALLAATYAFDLQAQQPPRPTSGPGANPLDTSEELLAKTKQDKGLKPHATPLTVTPLEKIPLAKIKVPAGFKVEVWAHGMPGARMMTRGDKGTIFVGTRAIGKVYAITDKGGERTHKVVARGPAAAERPRLQEGHAVRHHDRQVASASTASRTSSTARK